MDFKEIVRDIDRQVNELQSFKAQRRRCISLVERSATGFAPDEERCPLLAVLLFPALRKHAGQSYGS
jgi:hypothetical protein